MKRLWKLLANNKNILIGNALLIMGAILFLFRNTHESIWFDEACTYGIINRSIKEVLQLIAGDFHPPLYFVMLNIFSRIFGSTIFALRSFSAIGALFLVALGMGPIRRIFDRKVGLLFSLLVISTPITIVFAQEMRMYTWAAFLTTAAFCYGILGVLEDKKRDWSLFIVFSLGSVYTHFYGMLAMMALNSLLIVWILSQKRHVIKEYIIAVSIISFGTLPWLFTLLSQVGRVMNYYWIPPISAKTIWKCLSFPYSYKFHPNMLTSWTFLSALLVIVRGFIANRKDQSQERWIIKLLLLGFGLTLAFAITISLVLRPILVERYMISMLGIFLLLLAYGLSKLKRKTFFIMSLSVILALSSLVIWNVYMKNFNGPSPSAYKEFKGELRKDDVIVCFDEVTMGVCSYYYSDFEIIFLRERNTPLVANPRLFLPVASMYPSLGNVLFEYSGKRIWQAQSLFKEIAKKHVGLIEKLKEDNETTKVLESEEGYLGVVFIKYSKEI